MRTKPDGIDYPTLAEVASLGCCVCGAPAEVHHLIGPGSGHGMGMKSKHAIPLCPRHHNKGGFRESIHAGVESWEEEHGSQFEHLARVREFLGYPPLPAPTPPDGKENPVPPVIHP